ncbi:MAG: pilus assembly protein, partial [Microlunatus sp.]|nr:pilus assembly protein [Microlunatus sp.]
MTGVSGWLRRRVLPDRGSGDRGMATIQMVLLLPAVLTVLFAGMQAALWYHARAVAIAAAQEGARAAGA